MRFLLVAGVAMPLLALPAVAQTPAHPTPTPAPAMPAAPATNMPAAGTLPSHAPNLVPGTTANSAEAPLPGANSFTESQARSRLEKDGFSSVSALVKDKDGIWRGQASKGSGEHKVSVDYKGNIVSD